MKEENQPDSSPDSLPVKEVTLEVEHSWTGKCSLDGKKVKITVNINSYASLNLDPRAHCPECDVALV